MKKPSKDIDIEVYGINYEELNNFLSQYGRTDTVGKTFGIIKFRDKDKNEYDFSIPRKESKVGVGHKGFKVDFPKMTLKEAARRRDFTINTIAYDPLEKKIYDYYGGIEDIKNKIIRHTSKQFEEDPLRVLRGLQFQARFGFDLHPGTAKLMKRIVKRDEFKNLPIERVYEEWKKWAEKGEHHYKIFDYIHRTGLDMHYPHIGKLKNIKQDRMFHPEGDVEEHTKHVLKAAARIAGKKKLKGSDKAVLIYSALTHDLGKINTTKTEFIEKYKRNVVTSRGHEKSGGELAAEFLESIGTDNKVKEKVIKLTENHLAHININSIKKEKGKSGAVIKLSRRLDPATIKELSYLSEADSGGRPPLKQGQHPAMKKVLDIAARHDAFSNKVTPLIYGKDLIKLGYKPGVIMGVIIRKVEEMREDGIITDKNQALKFIEKNKKVFKAESKKN